MKAILAIFVVSAEVLAQTSSVSTDAARAGQAAASGDTAARQAPALPKGATKGLSLVDCDPSRGANAAPQDEKARQAAAQAAKNPDAEGAPADGSRPELPSGPDLAKAVADSAKANCVPSGKEKGSAFSVGVTTAPGVEGMDRPTLAPHVGISLHF